MAFCRPSAEEGDEARSGGDGPPIGNEGKGSPPQEARAPSWFAWPWSRPCSVTSDLAFPVPAGCLRPAPGLAQHLQRPGIAGGRPSCLACRSALTQVSASKRGAVPEVGADALRILRPSPSKHARSFVLAVQRAAAGGLRDLCRWCPRRHHDDHGTIPRGSPATVCFTRSTGHACSVARVTPMTAWRPRPHTARRRAPGRRRGRSPREASKPPGPRPG